MTPSSVSIPPELRRRIKRLAAEHDTSQAQIIEEAIDLFENKDNKVSNKWNSQELAFLSKVELDLFKSDPSRQERVKKLSSSKVDISDALISDWDSGILENDS